MYLYYIMFLFKNVLTHAEVNLTRQYAAKLEDIKMHQYGTKFRTPC